MSEAFVKERPEIRGQVSAEEWATRCDLAAAYRAAAMYGWDDLLFAHMSARVPGTTDQFLISPLNRGFGEMTASTLHKLNTDGKHVLPVTDDREQFFAFPFHRGIYRAFPQAQCVIHIHTRAATAVAMQKDGLLPSSQYALWLGPIGYHDYEGLISSPDEGRRLAANFKGGKMVIMRGHGFTLWDDAVSSAFVRAYLLDRACECQVMAGTGNLYVPPKEVIEATVGQASGILDKDGDFGPLLWKSILRRLETVAPDYRT